MYQGNSFNSARPGGDGFTKRSSGGRPPFRKTPPGGGSSRPAFGSSRPSFSATSTPGSRAPSRPSFSRGGSSARPSFSRGGSRPQGGRPSFGGGRGRGAPKGDHIDVSRFINKAVITESAPTYQPAHAFSDFNIDARLKHTIASKGYAYPTPIQDKAIPHILMGQDVVGIANTGTGKTAAFLIPLINKFLHDPHASALIMAPTRELAVQIQDEFKMFTTGMRLNSTLCIGGANIFPQVKNLRYHNHLIIGTPGRLADLIERKALKLDRTASVVLDEADRMLDMGFIKPITDIMALLPKERHTLFFSATMSREIEGLIKQFLKEPVSISVKTKETSESVEQDIIRVGSKNKVEVLHDLLNQPGFDRVLIFGRTKHGVEKLSKMLEQKGFKASSIHGNKSQGQRQRALDGFKRGETTILVATDVAARGLDISSVSHVINYDIPSTYEDYVHRIGRTGRGGKTGKAFTFVD
ncbi:MAG: DEAD/DEAH box helicase [Patescibacteria group bacterium]